MVTNQTVYEYNETMTVELGGSKQGSSTLVSQFFRENAEYVYGPNTYQEK